MENQTLVFTMEREPKNTVHYQEDADGKAPAKGTTRGCKIWREGHIG